MPYVATGFGLALTAGLAVLLKNKITKIDLKNLKVKGSNTQINLKGVTFCGKTQLKLNADNISNAVFKKGASLVNSTIMEGKKPHNIEGLSFIKDTTLKDLLTALNKNK